MKSLSWLLPRPSKDEEKTDLKIRLTQEVMRFERQRNNLEQVAKDVIKAMNHGEAK